MEEIKEAVVNDLQQKQKNEISLHDFVKNQIDTIKFIIAEYFGIEVEEMDSKCKEKRFVKSRQYAMYFAHKFFSPKISLAFIGDKIAKRDHATVLHAVNTVMDDLLYDKETMKDINEITQKLLSKVITKIPDNAIKKIEKPLKEIKEFPSSGQLMITSWEDGDIIQRRIFYDGTVKKLSIFKDGVPATILNGEAALTQFKQIVCSINA